MVEDAGTLEAALGAAAVLSRRAGLRLDPAVKGRLSLCVRGEAAAHGLEVTAYVRALETDPGLLQSLLDRVTVQETAFFRSPQQFQALRDDLLPELRGAVTIWSAGCSNGQEPYSLAMTLVESGIRHWRVIASDISNPALERTRQACYTSREVASLTPERRLLHLRPAGDRWRVVEGLRGHVDVVRHNLLTELPPFEPGGCQIAFCRNVLIYAGPREAAAFLHTMSQWLAPGGWLVVGYSESLWQHTEHFQLLRLGEAYLYRRRDPEAPELRAGSRAGAGGPDPLARAGGPRPDRLGRGPSGTQVAHTVPAGRIGDGAASGSAAAMPGGTAVRVVACRQRVYLYPDEPAAHLHLGFALEAAGDAAAAMRAFAAARQALSRCGDSVLEAALEGYHRDELTRLLDEKLKPASNGTTPSPSA